MMCYLGRVVARLSRFPQRDVTFVFGKVLPRWSRPRRRSC